MKYALLLSLLVFFVSCTKETPVAAPGVASWSTTSPVGKPLAREDGAAVRASVLVRSVDLENRLLTVEESNGQETILKVGPAVKRLAEIRAGDTITIQFIESLAYEVRPPTVEESKNPGTVGVIAARAGEDQAPAGGAVELLRAVLTIEAIDIEHETVTLRGPTGRIFAVHARDPQNLKRVKVGDTVVVTYSEAVAIGVEPAER